ncbi:hypothetical protein SUGI_0627960 [Cryptomeria japonica]|uniref:4-hydroxybenzoate polyprenyltransferase, mitochondrial n=1 Tax=Cryptomeria japonica TaxID=3369 RepID=UPI0024148939|nr:4-hydroxybenzoate polyprenyltransferase, mitochondrial [Cryptomeria japonica]GLJ31304.1 hypothetical protein SUGI_0627960 [Cryptomeria japonica]
MDGFPLYFTNSDSLVDLKDDSGVKEKLGMAHLLSSSSSSLIHPVCKTPLSSTSLHSHLHNCKAPSPLLNQRLHSQRNKYGSIHGCPLELKGDNSCMKPLSSIHYYKYGNRSWFQNQSTAGCSGLGEGVVNEGEKVSWIDTFLPRWSRPYAHLARLDWPTLLFVWPFMWSITLSAPSGNLPDFRIMLFIGVGTIFWRGAACTINDLLDQDIDAKVERTMSRPLVSGVLTPFQGLCFLGFQIILGLELLLQLNNYSRILGALWPLLAFTYPLMKRFTYWPAAYLGLSWNWGALLGWAAIKGSLDLDVVLPLYASGICWTLVYETIYAHQDKEDDLKVGVKSTALLFGDQTKTWITGFSIACISGLTLSGFNAGLGWPFYFFMPIAAGHFGWQIMTLDILSPVDCRRKFFSNRWFGAIVFIGIFLGRLII